jgi:hypothetical protein
MVLNIAALAMAGCHYTPDIEFDIDRYKQAVVSGFGLFPQAVEMERFFGEGDHSISYSGNRALGQRWHTIIYFGGRYEFVMEVPVLVDRRFSRIEKVLGEPTFSLLEITGITREPSGQIGCRYGRNYNFGVKDWERVVAAKGDLSVIGIHLKKGSPVPDFSAFVYAAERDQLLVRPDGTSRYVR